MSESHEAEGMATTQLAAAGVAIATNPQEARIIRRKLRRRPLPSVRVNRSTDGGDHRRRHLRATVAGEVRPQNLLQVSVRPGDPFLGEQLPWLSCMQQGPSLQLYLTFLF